MVKVRRRSPPGRRHCRVRRLLEGMQAGVLSAESQGDVAGGHNSPALGGHRRSWDFMVSAMGSHWSVAAVSAVIWFTLCRGLCCRAECSLKGEHTKTVQLPRQRGASCTRVVTVEPERNDRRTVLRASLHLILVDVARSTPSREKLPWHWRC